MRWRLWRAAIATLCLTLAIVATVRAEDLAPISKTALDDYIAKKDPAYSWKVVNTISGRGHSVIVVDMTSQTWLTEKDVDRTKWQHWLTIVKPDKVQSDVGMLLIGGGKNGGAPPDKASPESVLIALSTNTVVAELRMVPNQPLVFNGDGKGRSEDDLIAYAYTQFMKTGDSTWIPRLPMVKSAVRAMDTITAVMASKDGGKLPVDKFVVAGGSKRGWTTWLTGVADKRVVAIVPIVIDVLNVRASMSHHFEAYGFWAPAIGDYVRHKITDRMDDPKYLDLLKVEDPLNYVDRLTMPKYIVNASGDQFFLPDSSKFYFDELKGVKYLRYVPNADHSLRDSDAVQGILAFYQAVLHKLPMPRFSWTVQKDGSIRVQTKDKPIDVVVWQANNDKARDFRVEEIGKAWTKSKLEPTSDGLYVAEAPKPGSGFSAFYVELKFENGGKVPFKFTTQVSVVPDKLPFSIEDYRKSLKATGGE